MLYIVANLRLGDEDAAKERGFASVNEMDMAIISMWNSRISSDDDVYILGNFISEKADCTKYRLILRGRLKLVIDGYDYYFYRRNEFSLRSISTENFITEGGFNYHLYPGKIEIDKWAHRVDDILIKREKPLCPYNQSIIIDSERLNFVPLSLNEVTLLPYRKGKAEVDGEPFLLETVLPEDDNSYEERSAVLEEFFRKLKGLDGYMQIFYTRK